MATTTTDQQQQPLFLPNVASNTQSLSTTKFLSACFAGSVAGILGLQNFHGFLLFAFACLLSSAFVAVRNGSVGGIERKVHGGWTELVNPGTDNAAAFVLVWTLFYGVVHGMSMKLSLPLANQCLLGFAVYD